MRGSLLELDPMRQLPLQPRSPSPPNTPPVIRRVPFTAENSTRCTLEDVVAEQRMSNDLLREVARSMGGFAGRSSRETMEPPSVARADPPSAAFGLGNLQDRFHLTPLSTLCAPTVPAVDVKVDFAPMQLKHSGRAPIATTKGGHGVADAIRVDIPQCEAVSPANADSRRPIAVLFEGSGTERCQHSETSRSRSQGSPARSTSLVTDGAADVLSHPLPHLAVSRSFGLGKKCGSNFVKNDTGHHQLITYDFDSMQSWAAIPFILAHCSVFRLRKSLLFQMVVQLGVVFLTLLLVQSSDWNSHDADQDEATDEVEGGHQRRLATADTSPTAVLLALTTYLNRLVPFLLGLFVALCLRRWWTIRSVHLQKVYSSGAQLSFWLRTVLPQHAQWIRKRAERNFLLGHKLLYMCASCKDEMSILTTLNAGGLIGHGEYQRLVQHLQNLPKGARSPDGLYDFDLAALPFNWSAHLIYRVYLFDIRTKGAHGLTMPPPVLVKLLTHCMEARKGVECIEMMLSSPLPFPYVHLVCLLVHLSALFQCLQAGFSLGEDVNLTPQRMFCELTFIVAMNSLYCGLLCLAAVLWNPFGDDAIDFPMGSLHHRLWKAQHYSSSLLEEDTDIDNEFKQVFTHPRDKHEHDHKADEHDDDNDGETGETGEADDGDDGADD